VVLLSDEPVEVDPDELPEDEDDDPFADDQYERCER
jgi:hypothetical protein